MSSTFACAGYDAAESTLSKRGLGVRKGRSLSFQLNIRDAFTNGRPLVTRYNDNGIGVLRQVTQPPTTWRLTSSFEL